MNSRQTETLNLIKNTLDHEARQTDAESMKEFLNALADEAIDRLTDLEKATKKTTQP